MNLLNKVCLKSRINLNLKNSGIDSLLKCKNKSWFLKYPHQVTYEYNSRGFRDIEWPLSNEELKSSIWCVGDSFTVGLGQPYEHIWPQILQKKLNKRTINISLDGASNDWIFRVAQYIIDEVNPNNIILHFSFLHRHEIDNCNLPDEDRRIHFDENLSDRHCYEKFITMFNYFDKINSRTNKIYSIVPNFSTLMTTQKNLKELWNNVSGTEWGSCPKNLNEFLGKSPFILDEIKNFNLYSIFLDNLRFNDDTNNKIIAVEQVDYSRDYIHYGEKTCKNFVNQLLPHIK